jgi:phytanoyl-CoA hydroxylase
MLSQAQVDVFERDGFIAIEGFKRASELAALRERALAIVDDFDPTLGGIFTTHEQSRHVDDYFMDSADKPCAASSRKRPSARTANCGRTRRCRSTRSATRCTISTRSSSASRAGRLLAALARDLGLAAPQVWQSMYIFKQPGIGGEVGWHQDASFFETTPITVTTFWFALEDATLQNGCLWDPARAATAAPCASASSHGAGARMEKLDATPWPDRPGAVPLEVAAGTLVVLPRPAAALQRGQPLREVSRHAYTLHVTSARTRWSPRNWLQRGPGDPPLRGFCRVDQT